MISPLTSLRFLFALMVFGAHIYTIDLYFDHLFYKEGFVGVNFFFILSGFIIAYTYRDRLLEQKSTLREFWVARIARIYPLHLLTLGIRFVWVDIYRVILLTGSNILLPIYFFSNRLYLLPIISFHSTARHGVWDANNYFISCFLLLSDAWAKRTGFFTLPGFWLSQSQ